MGPGEPRLFNILRQRRADPANFIRGNGTSDSGVTYPNGTMAFFFSHFLSGLKYKIRIIAGFPGIRPAVNNFKIFLPEKIDQRIFHLKTAMIASDRNSRLYHKNDPRDRS